MTTSVREVKLWPRPTEADSATTSSNADGLANTNLLFFGLLLVVAIEYGGLTGIFPLLARLRISTLVAWGVALSVLTKVGKTAFSEYRQNRLATILVLWTGLSIFW